MAINKKLIHFKTKSNFDNELANGNILETSICFIKDTKEIWTHGQLYDCGISEDAIGQIISKTLFIGTEAEYEASSNDVAIGALVIITDQMPSNSGGSETSAILGTGVLGQLILGKN
jgi:hypothetical protein